MGFFKRIFGSDEKVTDHAFVGSQPKQGISMEEAPALQNELQGALSGDDVSDKVNAAARLMTSGAYRECIQAYEQIAQQHPEERGEAEGQIGAAYYFLGDYQKALEFYRAAVTHGADEDMMKDNIEEAEQALQKRS